MALKIHGPVNNPKAYTGGTFVALAVTTSSQNYTVPAGKLLRVVQAVPPLASAAETTVSLGGAVIAAEHDGTNGKTGYGLLAGPIDVMGGQTVAYICSAGTAKIAGLLLDAWE